MTYKSSNRQYTAIYTRKVYKNSRLEFMNFFYECPRMSSISTNSSEIAAQPQAATGEGPLQNLCQNNYFYTAKASPEVNSLCERLITNKICWREVAIEASKITRMP